MDIISRFSRDSLERTLNFLDELAGSNGWRGLGLGLVFHDGNGWHG